MLQNEIEVLRGGRFHDETQRRPDDGLTARRARRSVSKDGRLYFDAGRTGWFRPRGRGWSARRASKGWTGPAGATSSEAILVATGHRPRTSRRHRCRVSLQGGAVALKRRVSGGGGWLTVAVRTSSEVLASRLSRTSPGIGCFVGVGPSGRMSARRPVQEAAIAPWRCQVPSGAGHRRER